MEDKQRHRSDHTESVATEECDHMGPTTASELMRLHADGGNARPVAASGKTEAPLIEQQEARFQVVDSMDLLLEVIEKGDADDLLEAIELAEETRATTGIPPCWVGAVYLCIELAREALKAKQAGMECLETIVVNFIDLIEASDMCLQDSVDREPLLSDD